MLNFSGMPQSYADSLRDGATDANNQTAEKQISDGNGNPCRVCLEMIEKDVPFLVFAYRPFDTINPYTEIGPVFIHQHQCSAYNRKSDILPSVLRDSDKYLLRGYGADNRIVYGTGQVIAQEQIITYANTLLKDPAIRFVHVRSASNNCWQAKITIPQ